MQQSRNEAEIELAAARQDMEEALQHVEAAKKERDIARDLAASLLKEQAGFKQQVQDLSHAAHPEVDIPVSAESQCCLPVCNALHCLAVAVLLVRDHRILLTCFQLLHLHSHCHSQLPHTES